MNECEKNNYTFLMKNSSRMKKKTKILKYLVHNDYGNIKITKKKVL